MTHVWRVVKAKYAGTAFDGEGARLHGGRWNNVGTGVVYTSATASLALVELLVHLDSSAPLVAYVAIRVVIDDRHVERIDTARLPANWAANPIPPEPRAFGDAWVASRRSVAIEVPSVVVPHERNYMVNPAHPDFGTLTIGKPIPFPIDPRLVS